jgi:hypothetical protein
MTNLCGEWSDYTGVFLVWIQSAHYWPWPCLGATVAGLCALLCPTFQQLKDAEIRAMLNELGVWDYNENHICSSDSV